MAQLNPVSACCGVREISYLGVDDDPKLSIRTLGEAIYNTSRSHRFRHAFFTQANNPQAASRTYGEKFAAYITEHKLGKVVESDEQINPNSGNSLKVWIWTVDHEALSKHVGLDMLKDTPQGAVVQRQSPPTRTVTPAVHAVLPLV